jgi:Asp-tRNA(Asn)/Glu-tRNA(Gln) amidotransferase A subunit family amidase
MLWGKGTKMNRRLLRYLVAAPIAVTLLLAASASRASSFHLMSTQEETIAGIRAALEARDLTCRQLVQMYLDRIEAYDKRGPALNAIIMVNPNALGAADALDARFAQSGLTGPLHCVPLIVKDNFNTADMPTTAGSLSLKGSVPPADAFQVRKLREAGALVLAKSNLAEFAWSPFETVGSVLPGYTRNPYALDRVPAGSSGGTAAAVAASFGAVGLGTDTGNSIRGPSSHTSLVGIRSTMGLTSRDGIVPLFLNRDIGGPMARTVADAVAVFDVIAGPDPADPVTAASQRKRPDSYLKFLDKDGLRGARVGVLRQLFMGSDTDPEILHLLGQALVDMKRQGAEIVEAVSIPEVDQIPTANLFCNRFKYDLEAYLASLGSRSPVKNLDEVLASQKFHPSIEKRMRDAQTEPPPNRNPSCLVAEESGRRLARAVLTAMDAASLDVLVYPSWNNPPRLIGDLNTPHGNNSNRIAPPTGFPAMTVPMGFVRGGLPAGLQLLGRPWSEPTLIRIGYAYEQATRHRRAPASTPPLIEP